MEIERIVGGVQIRQTAAAGLAGGIDHRAFAGFQRLPDEAVNPRVIRQIKQRVAEKNGRLPVGRQRAAAEDGSRPDAVQRVVGIEHRITAVCAVAVQEIQHAVFHGAAAERHFEVSPEFRSVFVDGTELAGVQIPEKDPVFDHQKFPVGREVADRSRPAGGQFHARQPVVMRRDKNEFVGMTPELCGLNRFLLMDVI